MKESSSTSSRNNEVFFDNIYRMPTLSLSLSLYFEFPPRRQLSWCYLLNLSLCVEPTLKGGSNQRMKMLFTYARSALEPMYSVGYIHHVVY